MKNRLVQQGWTLAFQGRDDAGFPVTLLTCPLCFCVVVEPKATDHLQLAHKGEPVVIELRGEA